MAFLQEKRNGERKRASDQSPFRLRGAVASHRSRFLRS
jgi:hypothetical protein